MEANSQDLRRSPRCRTDVYVTLQSEHNFYTGFTENISSGGLFIATRDMLPIGARFAMAFSLPTTDHPIQATCEVRWQRLERLDDAFCTPGMGVRFLDLTPEDERAINTFISQRETLFYDDE